MFKINELDRSVLKPLPEKKVVTAEMLNNDINAVVESFIEAAGVELPLGAEHVLESYDATPIKNPVEKKKEKAIEDMLLTASVLTGSLTKEEPLIERYVEAITKVREVELAIIEAFGDDDHTKAILEEAERRISEIYKEA